MEGLSFENSKWGDKFTTSKTRKNARKTSKTQNGNKF